MRQQRRSPLCYLAPSPPDLRWSRSARITEALSACMDPRVSSCSRRARTAKLSPAGRSAASRMARCSASADRSCALARCFSRRTRSASRSRTRSVAIAAIQSASAYASIKARVATAYLRCESTRDRASCVRPSHPARERAESPPPPKAQPAPGNAQATGTAPGSGISGKPAGTPRVCRTDGVRRRSSGLNLSGPATEGGHPGRHDRRQVTSCGADQ